MSEPHAHVLDPTWSQGPVPWAEGADATLLARIHAACLDDCWDCLEFLAHETTATAENTAVVMGMGFGVYVMFPPSMRSRIDEKLEYATAFMKLLRHVKAMGQQGVSTSEVLDLVRTFDPEERWNATDASIQLMGLYTQALQEKEA